MVSRERSTPGAKPSNQAVTGSLLVMPINNSTAASAPSTTPERKVVSAVPSVKVFTTTAAAKA